MRRLLAAWIVLALATGAVLAVPRADGDKGAAHFLPEVLPVGFTLTSAKVAEPGATLANPLSYRRAVLRRPGDRVFARYVAAPADPDGRVESVLFRRGRRVPFGDGVAFVDHDWVTRVWWSTSTRSGTLWSATVEADELLAIAHRFDRSGFVAPPGWKGLASFDVDSAVESLQYAGPDGQPSLHLDVHLDREVLEVTLPEQTMPYAQRQLGRAVVTAVAASSDSGLTTADLRAVADSVREVDAGRWRSTTAAAEVDGRAVRWTPLAAGRTSTNAGWALAAEDRDDQRCLALLVVEHAVGAEAPCDVSRWRTDLVLAVATDRSGPARVTVRGRSLPMLGEARFEGRRILVVELPADLWGQVIDPLAVVGRR